jgi:hypothetical protein
LRSSGHDLPESSRYSVAVSAAWARRSPAALRGQAVAEPSDRRLDLVKFIGRAETAASDPLVEDDQSATRRLSIRSATYLAFRQAMTTDANDARITYARDLRRLTSCSVQ